MGTNRTFDRDKITVTVVRNGVPIDVTSGLLIDGDIWEVENAMKEESQTRYGMDDESYTALGVTSKAKIAHLRYLPGATGALLMKEMKKQKENFGLVVKNTSSPAYIYTAESCYIQEDAATKINGKSGFSDHDFTIMCGSGEEEFL